MVTSGTMLIVIVAIALVMTVEQWLPKLIYLYKIAKGQPIGEMPKQPSLKRKKQGINLSYLPDISKGLKEADKNLGSLS